MDWSTISILCQDTETRSWGTLILWWAKSKSDFLGGTLVLWYAKSWPEARSFGPGQVALAVQAVWSQYFLQIHALSPLFTELCSSIYEVKWFSRYRHRVVGVCTCKSMYLSDVTAEADGYLVCMEGIYTVRFININLYRVHSLRQDLPSLYLNPFPNKPLFLRVGSTNLLKTLWEKEKLLVTSNFSFFHSVFYPFQELSTIFIKFEILVCKLFKIGRV